MAGICCSTFGVGVVMMVIVILLGIRTPGVYGQAPAPARTSDGILIDQGVAYVLMLLALILTYLIHPMDASPVSRLF